MPSVDTVLSEASEAERAAYQRLLRILRAAREMFALIPVECDFGEEQTTRWLERLHSDLAQENITLRIASLSRELWDPIDAIERVWEGGRQDQVILLRGLEKTPAAAPADSSSRPPAYARLNIHREAIEQHFPVPLVVWCESSSFEAFRRHAPDFFDHFTGLVYFTRRLYRCMAARPDSFVHRRELDAVRHSPLCACSNHDAIHDHVDVVGLAGVEIE